VRFPVSLKSPLAVLAVALGLAACAPVVQPPGPGLGAAAAPAIVAGTAPTEVFVTGDGIHLPLRRWLPDGPPRAVVLALHGFGDTSNAFAMPAPRFTADGVALYAYDQRGFGGAPHHGRWPGVDRLIGDARDAVRLLRARHPGTPLYVMGESMGATILLAALTGEGAPEVDGAILLAAAVWSADRMPWLYRATLWFAAHTIPWYPLSGQGLKIIPTDNPEALRRLRDDPQVIKQPRVDLIGGLVGAMGVGVRDAPAFDVPALIAYGLRDEIIRPDPMRATLDSLPKPPEGKWRLAIYPEGYHLLLRDLQANRVIDDILAWTRDRDAPLPSGADWQSMRRLHGEPVEPFAPSAALR